MQTIKNKTFLLINLIRLLIKVGIIISITVTSFLVQKQPVYAAINSEGTGSFFGVKNNYSALEDLISQSSQPTESLPSAAILQWKIFIPLVVNQDTHLIGGESTSIPPTPTSTSVSPTPMSTATSVPPTPTSTSVIPTPMSTATSVPPTTTPTITSVPTQNPSGNTYYVATNGNDVNLGTLTQPFRTIQKGANTLVAGDTLYIRGGIYAEHITINVSGSSEKRITISPYPGEAAIIDGTSLNEGSWAFIVDIEGSFITIQNLELTYPTGHGIRLDRGSDYCILDNLNIHDVYSNGILVWGDHNTIINNSVSKVMLLNSPNTGSWGGALAIGDTSHDYYGMYSTVKNNKVFNSYGEGILCMDTDNILIEGNTVYNNWAVNIYLDTCSFATIRNNIVYYTSDKQYWRHPVEGYTGSGIFYADEGNIPGHPIGHDIDIYNNIVVAVGTGIQFGAPYAPGAASINVNIIYNTIIVNTTYAWSTGIYIPGAYTGYYNVNTIIKNNLVDIVNTGGYVMGTDSLTGLTFSHNQWSVTPTYSGPGDVVGNPLLSNPTHSIDAYIDAAWYKITLSSPGIGHAIATNVLTDYFWVTRDSTPDMGAFEH
jgi:parallel beta-helix repeat protein